MRLESLSWFTLGGDSLDWCIEAGVDSVEHGIYMNQRQAYELAKRQILYVPTVAVYKLLAEKENPMQVANLLQSMRAWQCRLTKRQWNTV